VSHVREEGKGRLRDRWSVLAAAFDGLDEEEADDLDVGDIFEEEDDEDGDEVDLDRPTCETAEGDHGVDWALAVHVARRLGYTPREIHNQARGLFGAPLPCDHGEGETCEYADGWDRVTDPDATPDLLVGSYVHAHVESVRTEYTPGAREGVDRAPRAVVLDEFPGEAFVREFDAEAEDHATWLARCLRDDVEDRRDMLEADLAGDDFVSGWLEGREGDDPATAGLARVGDHLDARNAAEEILDEVERGALEAIDLAEPLEAVVDADTDAADAFGDLDAAIDDVDPEHPASGLARWADDAVRTPLARATLSGSHEPTPDAVDTDALGIGADLEALVDEAVEAARERRDGAAEAVEAAVTALRGGREGCRRLAAWATDGYAHPDAHHLLGAVVEEEPTRVETSSWAFDPDATDGTVVDVVETGARARTVLDRNGHGARIHTPPSRTSGSGDDAPLVGLDATGRAELWSNALGEPVETADIHDTPEERAAFLEDALDLRVLQAADRPRPYEGDPTTKDTDGDVALLEAIAEEYSGLQAPRERGDDPVAVGKPAAITTKGVRGVLENDTRLDDVVAEWENYGNLTGDNQLGDHRLAAILGSQHYGDHAIERFCALAGEEVDTDRVGGRGADLEYGSGLANAYLQHMREDQTMQAILRFTRGDSGATVVARTSALREDLPVVGDAQVVETWSDTATEVARAYRRLGAEFTIADVADAVDVTRRQVRRVLAELAEAGYIRRVGGGSGVANVYEPADTPGAGEVDLPEREAADPGRSPHNQYYTWNVRVFGGETAPDTARDTSPPRQRGAPPAPTAVDTGDPPT
jgi:DNA-binding transcriptional ArsR family regulator